MFLSNVFIVDSIPVDMPIIDVKHHTHLKDVLLVQGQVNVEILIGQENSEALLPLEVRKGKPGEPFATRTLFGWSLNGPANDTVNKRVTSHFISTLPPVKSSINDIWSLEHGNIFSEEVGMSAEDEQVLRLWENNCEMSDGHYVIPIPWREGKAFPNNLVSVVPQLNSLKRTLMNKGLYDRYNEEMEKLLAKGYAESVPDDQIVTDNKVWYLPHHPVVTDKKPGKLRVVFDCAAKYKGESLNDKAYQGPDLNNKLLHVLLRFRQGTKALMADIETMYNQVRVPEHDRDALRFVWYDEKGLVKHFRMTSHLFGGVWCASAATYALRRVTRDQEVTPVVHNTI